MLKILTIIGARPQIIKAAALNRAVQKQGEKVKEIILHTGQHYDENMSKVFFDELQIPQPNYNLNVGSGSHGRQTAAMISGIEEVVKKEKPDCLVVYGDTNSTLAAAIAASKIHVPVVHIEAGLRSYNKSMPEEVNRIMCDHVSTLMFSPTKAGYENLLKEGFKENNPGPYHINNPKIYRCGDVMYDNTLYFSTLAQDGPMKKKYELDNSGFILSTIHRDSNTDDPVRLNSLFRAMLKIAEDNKIQVVLPLHPRTGKLLEKNLEPVLYDKIVNNSLIKILPPVSFSEMIALEKNAEMVLTDSGGVQKEAFFFKKPCIIFRPETEWVELVECGSAIIADADEEKITAAYNKFKNNKKLSFPSIFGDGNAAEFICEEIIKNIPH